VTLKKQPHLVLVVALLSMIGPFTTDAYLPSFPKIEAAFDVTRGMMSQSLSTYLFMFAISTLFWGPLSDRFGRRLIIFVSLALYVLASFACGLVENYHDFLLIRGLQGLAASGGFVTGRAMIRDAYNASAAHKAMAQVSLMFALAPAVAPVFGAWLDSQFGWHSVFYFLSIFGVFLILLVAFVDETLGDDQRQTVRPRAVIRVYTSVLMHRQFLALVLSLSFLFAGFFLYIAGAPTIIYDFLGLQSSDFALLFIPIVAGLMLGAFISSHLAHKVKIQTTITLGFMLVAMSVLLNLIQSISLEASVITVIAPVILYALGFSIVMPAITILALDCFPKNRGSAASMQGFFQMFFSAMVASIAIPLLQGERIYFAAGQFILIFFAVLLWLYIKTRLNVRPFMSS